MGYYLANSIELYQNSCQTEGNQLFIRRDDIQSILTVLGMISGLVASYNAANPCKGEVNYVLLARRINRILEQIEHTNWPENAPQDYDPNDIKWPELVQNPSAKGKSLDPTANNQGQAPYQ